MVILPHKKKNTYSFLFTFAYNVQIAWIPIVLLSLSLGTAKVQYGTSLSNVDWLHGGAESLLTLTNLFIVLGLRGALKKSEEAVNSTSSPVLELEKEKA